MTDLDKLTHYRIKVGGGREEAAPWQKPWPGPTVWIASEPDYEDPGIIGVTATIEDAWKIVRAKPGCPTGPIGWEQDERTGAISGAGRYWIEPEELHGGAAAIREAYGRGRDDEAAGADIRPRWEHDEMPLDLGSAQRVSLEIVTEDGITFEIELENCSSTSLKIERDSKEVPSDDMWRHWVSLETGEVDLRAHGKLVKTERRVP